MIFVLRLSRTQSVVGPRYLTSTAIFLAEPLKLVVSFAMHGWTSTSFSEELASHIFHQPVGMLKTSVPGLLYALQNNLLFIGLSGLTASTYQLTCQLKILTTAAMSVLILGTRLSRTKWFALVLLTLGVLTANMTSGHSNDTQNLHGNTTLGLVATIAACFTSAIAGVYIEKLMKESTASLWVRNIQFSFWGMIFSGLIAFRADGEKIKADGFLQGYNPLVWVVVCFHALSGICVAMVLKYADNILKCFASALAIIFSCALSILVFHEATIDSYLVLGVILVICAANIYGFGLPDVEELYRSYRNQGFAPLLGDQGDKKTSEP
jgi:UDP-sugar transporter A1/2/3